MLDSGATRAPDERTGDMSRMFSSRLFEADGIEKEPGVGTDLRPPEIPGVPLQTPDFNVTFHYTGRLQYYGLRVPSSYPDTTGKLPLIVYLHGFTGLPDEAFYNPVGLVDEAERRGYLVATPLGRGDHFYAGPGDLDVLEVIRDVRAPLPRRPQADLPDGSLDGRLRDQQRRDPPSRHCSRPSRPPRAPTSIPLHANLRNVPWFEISSLQDLDAGAADAKRMYDALSADGYLAKLLVYSTKIHEYSSIYDTLPQLFDFFGSHRLRRNPGVVTWTRPAGEDRPDLGLVYDGAYWLDRVRASDPSQLGTITVDPDRIPHSEPDPADARRTDEQVDTEGPTGRSMGELYSTEPAAAPNVRRANALTVNSERIAAVAVDAHRARVGFRRSRLTIRSRTDVPLKLGVRRLKRARGVLLVDGRRVRRVRTRSGRVTLAVPAGRHTLVLRPLRRAGARRGGRSPQFTG